MSTKLCYFNDDAMPRSFHSSSFLSWTECFCIFPFFALTLMCFCESLSPPASLHLKCSRNESATNNNKNGIMVLTMWLKEFRPLPKPKDAKLKLQLCGTNSHTINVCWFCSCGNVEYDFYIVYFITECSTAFFPVFFFSFIQICTHFLFQFGNNGNNFYLSILGNIFLHSMVKCKLFV